MKRIGNLIVALIVCVGLESGCGTQTPHPSLFGTWVGTVTGDSYVQESVRIAVSDTVSVYGTTLVDITVLPDDLTPLMQACVISTAPTTAYTENPSAVSMINWTSATTFTATAPSVNPISFDGEPIGPTTVKGVYNPNTPNTFTGTITAAGSGTLSGQGAQATCSLTGNFTVTLQPAQ
jgi:hypothetical protein